ncbi:DNA-methyltransferase [Candidatus Poriferisodalis sp.]|uniref:DNA-methyltransferase n=1 Tax=Candidatus Poriferisodalis sp. TaxID=3101277 RepID=UPI003B02C42E
MNATTERKLALRAAVNEWIGGSFPEHRMLLSHDAPVYEPQADAWSVKLTTKRNGVPAVHLGSLLVAHDASIIEAPVPANVLARLPDHATPETPRDAVIGDWYAFHCGDGIEAAAAMPDRSIDLLLTDPPYGISKRYTCETQVPRRLRNDGSDFIMPKGHFGDWDEAIDPHAWTSVVLPKVAGWAVTFCAQAQIGTYCDIFTEHGLVAVGPMVWQKTNPVPFNHKYKPVNAWEAVVVGKRPSTPFNGEMVHNVFVHKSPSPQQRIHPTQKPLPLVAEFVDLFSEPNGLVFDPFAGSATTVIAARQHGRRGIGYELDPMLFALAAERVDAELGKMSLL